MKQLSVTKKEIRKSLDYKRIILNVVIYTIIYLLVLALGINVLLFVNPTYGLIEVVIGSCIMLLMIGYQVYRLFYLVNGYKNFKCYEVRLERINYYMNGKIPVFAVPVHTSNGTEIFETNAIYKLKQIPLYQNFYAKVLVDEKKKRIYVITLIK